MLGNYGSAIARLCHQYSARCGHLAETRGATSYAWAVVYPADSIYTRYTSFGKTGEPSGGRMSVPSKVQLMNE